MVEPQYAYVANGSLAVTGQENQKFNLSLDVVGNRDWKITLPLYLQECPPGFKINKPAYSMTDQSPRLQYAKCECISGEQTNSFRGNLFCEQSSFTAKIRNGYWIGTIPNVSGDEYVMGSTKLMLRNDIPEEFVDLTESQCQHLNRKGPLCGECLEGYSTAVNYFNYKCVECNNNTNIAKNVVAYIGLTYIPYLLIFGVIIYYEIKIMAAPLVCFILYAQLVSSGVIDLTLGHLPSLQNDTGTPLGLLRAYRIVYGVFNLNSFSVILDPFCVNENFSALDVISLDFAIGAFPLIIIVVIRLLMLIPKIKRKKTTKLSIEATTSSTGAQSAKKTKTRSMIHPIVAFVYLSYTKVSVSAALILSNTAIFKQDGSLLGTRVVYYAGQYYFGQLEYILPYGLMAILVYIFVTALLPLLLLGPFDLFNRLTDKDRYRFLNNYVPSAKINTFMEAFRNCYKKEYRCFAGIYFIFRLVMLTIYAFSSNVIVLAVWQIIFVILIIILVTNFKPYKEPYYNYIDIAMFLNMAVILVCSLYLYTLPNSDWQNIDLAVYIIGSVLIWIPFLYLIVYLGWLFLKSRSCFRNYFPIIFRSCHDAGTETHPLIDSVKGPSDRGFEESTLMRRSEEKNFVQSRKSPGSLGDAEKSVIT